MAVAGVAVAAVAVAGDRLGGLHRAPRAAVVSGCHTRTGDGAMWCGLNLLPRIHMLPSSDRDLYGDGGSGGARARPWGQTHRRTPGAGAGPRTPGLRLLPSTPEGPRISVSYPCRRRHLVPAPRGH